MDIPDDILQIKDLSVGYIRKGKTHGVIQSNINLSARKGELVAVAGSNGSGKTTLLRTLCRLLPPLKGEIFINGRSFTEIPRSDFARIISFVSTEQLNVDRMSVFNLVSLGRFPYTNWLGKLSEKDLQIVNKSVELTSLNNIISENIDEISDGERQKAMIARALAQDSHVIVLDEPTAFLDLGNKFEIVSILLDMARQKNKIIIFSVHDLNLALQVADKLWLFSNNEILEGAPEDLCINNAVGEIFNNAKLEFDKINGEFIMRKNYCKNVSVSGKGNVSDWTKKALNRLGFSTFETLYSDFLVEVTEKGSNYLWLIRDKENETEYHSIYDMTCHIKLKYCGFNTI